MKKILPVKFPEITGYQGVASLMAVLSNYEKTYSWIYSNYIQTYGYIRNGNFELTLCPGFYGIQMCPWIKYALVDRTLVNSICKGDICRFFMDCLDNNYYIYGMLNQAFFSQYNTSDQAWPHDTFIYGYDQGKQLFALGDFTFSRTGKYSFQWIPFDEVARAYETITETMDRAFLAGKGGLLLFTVFLQTDYPFDTQLVKETIIEYLNSTNSSYRLRAIESPNTYALYGMDLYKGVSDFFQSVLSGQYKCDLKPLHNLVDHKYIMLKRLSYMSEKGLLSDFEKIYADYREIYDEMRALSNLAIKYRLTQNPASVEKIIVNLPRIKAKEQNLLEVLLKNIKDTPVAVSPPDWFGVNSNINKNFAL